MAIKRAKTSESGVFFFEGRRHTVKSQMLVINALAHGYKAPWGLLGISKKAYASLYKAGLDQESLDTHSPLRWFVERVRSERINNQLDILEEVQRLSLSAAKDADRLKAAKLYFDISGEGFTETLRTLAITVDMDPGAPARKQAMQDFSKLPEGQLSRLIGNTPDFGTLEREIIPQMPQPIIIEAED